MPNPVGLRSSGSVEPMPSRRLLERPGLQLLLIAAVAASLESRPPTSGQAPDPVTWPAYKNHSCHAVGAHARVVNINNATRAQCAAACAAKGCLCYDMLVDSKGVVLGRLRGAGGSCRGTIDGVLIPSSDRIVRPPFECHAWGVGVSCGVFFLGAAVGGGAQRCYRDPMCAPHTTITTTL